MENFATTLLTNEELIGASGQLLPVLGQIFADDRFLTAVNEAAQKDLAGLALAGTRVSGDKLTDPVRQADEARDQAFTSLRDFAAAWAGNAIATPEQRAAGERLRAILVKHGVSLHRAGYIEQSGLLEKLFAELVSEPAQADLVMLNLTPLHQKLIATEQAFQVLWKQRSDGEGVSSLPRVRDHLPALKRRLNLLLDAARERALLEPPQAMQDLLDQLEGLIREAMKPVLARQTKSKKKAAGTPKPKSAPSSSTNAAS